MLRQGITLIVILCQLGITGLFGQHTDCASAYQVCNNTTLNFNSFGSGTDDFANSNNGSGCLLFKEHQSVWLVVKVAQNSPANARLGFNITPVDPSSDFDFAVYGPTSICGNLGIPTRCSYASVTNPACTWCPATGLGNNEIDNSEGANGNGFVAQLTVQPFQIYYILVDNFEADFLGFQIAWTGNAILDCDFNCMAQAGSVNIPAISTNQSTGFPVANTTPQHYVLCDGDRISLASGQNYALPQAAPGQQATLLWAIYNQQPPAQPAPSDAGFTGTLVDADTLLEVNTAGQGTLNGTNKTIWAVPVASDDAAGGPNGAAGIDTDQDGCYRYGTPVKLTYLTPMSFSLINGCNYPVVTVRGGDSEVQGSVYTISDLLPVHALPSTFNPKHGVPFHISNLTQGDSYSFKVRDANGCTLVVSGVFQSAMSLPEAVIGLDGGACIGQALNLLGSSPTTGISFQYQWTSDNGFSSTQQNPVVVPSRPGKYTLVVTVDGCASLPVTIDIQLQQPPDIYPLAPQKSCAQVFDLETVQLIGAHLTGTEVFYYSDAGNVPGSQIGNLVTASGKYWIEARIGTPPSVCSDFESIEIGLGDLTVSNVDATAPSCTSISNGAINISVYGGVQPYTFKWSNNALTEDASNLAAGTYTVTITDVEGCTKAETVVLEVVNPLSLVIDAVNSPSCQGSSDGSIAVHAEGGTSPYVYNWNVGGIFEVAEDLAAGSYSVTVFDANGCKATRANITLTNPILLPVSVNTSPTMCGQATGQAEVIVQGAGPFTYVWSHDPLLTGNVAMNLPGGGGIVTVTSAAGCTRIMPYGITSSPVGPEITTVQIEPSKCNYPNGSATVAVTGGNGVSYLKWSDPFSTVGNTLSNVVAGTYFVTATDGNGCISTHAVEIPLVSSLSLQVVNIIAATCPTAKNGKVTVLATGGTPPYTYFWGHNANLNNPFLTTLAPGAYSVGVQDASGCFAYTTLNVPYQDIMELQVDQLTPATCGQSNGAIKVRYLNAAQPISFQWINQGNITNLLQNVPASNYTVIASDLHGCSQTKTITVPNLDGPVAAYTAQPPTGCTILDGVISLQVTGGQSPYTYAWSHNPTLNAPSATQLRSGDYRVTVTDAGGCTNVVKVTNEYLNLNPPNIDSTLIVHTVCDSSTGIIETMTMGGVPPYTWQWSHGPTTANVNMLHVGGYAVTVTDALGCTDVSGGRIKDPLDIIPPFLFIAHKKPACGQNNGWIQAYVPPGQTIKWIGHPEWGNQTLVTGLGPGTYGATAEGNLQTCIKVRELTLTEYAPPTLMIDSLAHHSCVGTSFVRLLFESDSSKLASVQWSHNPNFHGLQAANLPGGNYTVTTRDTFGCEAVVTFDILQNANGPQVQLDTVIHTRCGTTNGRITVIGSGGTGTLRYKWSHNPALNSPTAQNLLPGTYTVTVTDAGSCSNVLTVQVNSAGAPAIQLVEAVKSQCGIPNGSIEVKTNGGQSPLTYKWSHNPALNLSKATLLYAGTYTVSVTDVNGCGDSLKVVLSDTGGPTVAIGQITAAQCANEGSISVQVSGGTMPYTYIWSHDALLNSPAATQLIGGTYAVEVRDANGCKSGQTAFVDFNPVPQIILDNLEQATCGTNNGNISIAVGNAEFPLSYDWSHSPGANVPYAQNLPQATYTVTVTNASGCTAAASYQIQATDAPAISVAQLTQIDCNNQTGTIQVNVQGGVNPYTYFWSHDAALKSNLANQLASGLYQLTVADATGCTTTGQFLIQSQEKPQVIIDSIMPAYCGQPNGGIYLRPLPEAAYRIKSGATQAGLIGPDGAKFARDSFFLGGTLVNIDSFISHKRRSEDAFYAVSRRHSSALRYQFPVPAGTYRVLLHFAKGYGDPTGPSNFDIRLNGVVVETGLNPAQRFGWNVAGTLEYTYSVTTDRLLLELLGTNPQIAAIEVIPMQQPSYQYAWSMPGAQGQLSLLNAPSGNFTLTLTNAAGCVTTQTFTVPTVTSVATAQEVQVTYPDCGAGVGNLSFTPVTAATFRINVGNGGPYVTLDGRKFDNDRFNLSGVPDVTNGSFSNTVDDHLYQSSRKGKIEYALPTGNGVFDLILHVYEKSSAPDPNQIMNADAEDVNLFANLNLKQVCGGPNLAYTDTFQVVVTDSILNLDIYGVVAHTALCAFEVIRSVGPQPYTVTWPGNLMALGISAADLSIGDHPVVIQSPLGCADTVMLRVPEPDKPILRVTDVKKTECNSAIGSIEVEALTNLATNGDFERGNIGFKTDYYYSNTGASPRRYTVTDNPRKHHPTWAPCADHTTGRGLMMITDAAQLPGLKFYCQTFSVPKGVQCEFSVWATMIANSSLSALQFYVNGKAVGDTLHLTPTLCEWQQLESSWISDTTVAEVCIVSHNLFLTGNDFALDDFKFFSHGLPVSWSHDAQLTGSVATGLAFGDYTISATNAFGCTVDTTVLVRSDGFPELSVQRLDPAGCFGQAPGMVTLSGGARYRINAGGSDYTSPISQNVFEADNYVTGGVVFNNNNPISGTFDTTLYKSNRTGNISYALPLEDTLVQVFLHFAEPNLASRAFHVSAEGNQVLNNFNIASKAGGLNKSWIEAFTVGVKDSILNLAFTGVVGNPIVSAIEVYAVTPGVQYTWSHNAGLNAATATGLDGGHYTVHVVNSFGCENDITVQVPFVSGPTLTLLGAIEPALCLGIYGEAEIESNDPNVTWTWSHNPNITGPIANDLVEGTYEIVATALNGCKGKLDLYINDSSFPDVIVEDKSGSNCIDDAGFIKIRATGGAGSYTYSWSHNLGLNSTLAENLGPGTYSVTVIDKNGCPGDTVIVLELFGPQLNITSLNPTVCNAAIGSVVVADTGMSIAPVVYQWLHDASITSTSLSGLSDGIYTLIATDANHCADTVSVQIENANGPQIFDIIVQEPDSCVRTNGVAVVQSSGGNLNYQWSHDQNLNQSMATGLGAGTYTITVSDGQGCTNRGQFTIETVPEVQLSLGTILPEICGNLGGSLQVLVAGGQAPYQYAWAHDPSLSSSVLDSLAIGQYQLIVTTAQQCKDTIHIDVPGITAPVLLAAQTTATPCTQSVGAIQLNTLEPQDSLVFTWAHDPLLSGANASQLSSGAYAVTITNSYQCAFDTIITVEQTSGAVQSNQSETLCNGQTFTYAGISFATDTTFAVQLLNAQGCDSVHTLSLVFLPNSAQAISSYTCDPTATGVFTTTLIAANGCDSVLTNTVTLVPTDTTWLTGTTCDAQWAGWQYSTLQNIAGCDSVVATLNTLLPSDTVQLTATTCDPSQAGVFYTRLANQYGCDSLIVLTRIELPKDTVHLYNETCIVLQAGETMQMFQNNYGCDSMVITHTELMELDTSFMEMETCHENEVGDFLHGIFPNQFGCDSIVVRRVKLNQRLYTVTVRDQWLKLGEVAQLQAYTQLMPDEITWTPSDRLSCTDCLDPEVLLLETTEFHVNLLYPDGCEVDARFTVYIDDNVNIYVPNVFKPDGNGTNDYWTAFSTKGVEELEDVRVFDRWGNLVFRGEHLTPGDELSGWDGNFRNSPMVPGVYSWMIKAKLLNGKYKHLEGDVTIVR